MKGENQSIKQRATIVEQEMKQLREAVIPVVHTRQPISRVEFKLSKFEQRIIL